VDLIDKAVRFMWDVSDWRGWRIVARMPPRSLYSPSFSRVVGPGADGLWAVFDQEHMSFKTSPMSLDGTARAAHHGLSVMELAAMEVVHAHLLGPVTITRDTIFHGTVRGDVTVLGGVHLDLLGTVLGNLLVEDSGTACVRGAS